MLVKFESSVLCFCQHFLLELYSCNAKLASVSVEPCSYQFQADKIEKMTQDLQTLQRYAGSQQIAWMLGAATGCIVSTAGMNLVFRNPKTGVVRECSVEEITSLEKLDASEIDITKLGKEVPADDLELYMRYRREGSIEHFFWNEGITTVRTGKAKRCCNDFAGAEGLTTDFTLVLSVAAIIIVNVVVGSTA